MAKINFKISKTVLFLGLLILVSPFIYTKQILDPVMLPRACYFALVILPFLIVFTIRILRSKEGTEIFSDLMFWVYLAYVLLSGISVIGSLNPGEGIWEFLKICLFFMIFVSAISILKNEQKLHKILPVLVLVFSATILIFGTIQLLDVLHTGRLDHQSSYKINSVFAHRNLFAQMLFFTIPFLLMGAYFLKGLMRFLSIFFIALSLVFITLLLVKSVWLALVVSSVFAFFILFIFRKAFLITSKLFKHLILYAFAALMIVLVSVAIYSRYNSIETFEKQTYVLKDYRFGSAIERVHLWEKSIEMFRDSPVVGVGLGNWRIYLPHYGTSGMRSAEGEIIYQRPHNDFLWVLAERGIVAACFYVFLFLLALFYLFKIIKNAPEQIDKITALLLIFFLTGYLIIAFLSFPSERPVHSMMLNLVLAIALVKYSKIKRPAEALNKTGILVMLSLGILALLSLVYVGIEKMKSEHHIKNALTFRIESQWQNVIKEIDQAENYFTKLDPTATPLRWYSGLSWFNLGKMDMAFGDFQEAYKANPYHMHVVNNLATIYGNRGDYEKAIVYYKKALEISPDFTDAALNLSASLYNIRQIDSAYAVLRRVPVLNDNPNYKNIVQALVFEKVENLKQTMDDRDLELTLTRIRNSDEWMLKVHKQAIHDNISLEKHLIIESIYMLETVDKTIDGERATYLRKKYISK